MNRNKYFHFTEPLGNSNVGSKAGHVLGSCAPLLSLLFECHVSPCLALHSCWLYKWFCSVLERKKYEKMYCTIVHRSAAFCDLAEVKRNASVQNPLYVAKLNKVACLMKARLHLEINLAL